MRKYFKDNTKYFNYINKHKREINIIEVKPVKNSVRLTYLKKSPEEIERETGIEKTVVIGSRESMNYIDIKDYIAALNWAIEENKKGVDKE